MMVRALRLGFAPIRGGFMRISGGEQGKPFLCELQPFCLIPNSVKSDGPHWVWWAGPSSEGINYNHIEGVRHLRLVKIPFSFYFDDEGKTI